MVPGISRSLARYKRRMGSIPMDQLQGQVERITYTNEESGYSVVRVKVRGRRDLVTVVGSFVSVIPGEVLRMEGTWGYHGQYGEQFKVERYETITPATVEGIRKYLGSGLIKGIGPVMAGRIVKRFGEQTLTVIDEQPERLREIEGVGTFRAQQIRQAWDDQREVRDVMVFLRGHEISAAFAARIFKHYGKESLKVLNDNPYRLAMDVHGIGFVSADKIARNLGFAVDSPLRAEAGALYVLQEAADDGHVCAPYGWLMGQGLELLGIPRPVFEEALMRLVGDQRIVIEELPAEAVAELGDERAVYLCAFYLAETQVARRLKRLLQAPRMQRKVDSDKALLWVQERLSVKLAPLQAEAVRRALTDKVLIITGGPGTGKTTLIQAILLLYQQMKGRICLAAPTGRAAKRLSEATRHAASTIHRLLEYGSQAGGFQRNDERPLTADLVVVDEASMLDCLLTNHLLKAIPLQATLVLVGDVDQLPSVGPGAVLDDIIASRQFPVVRLTEIFRQARQSHIVVNAHRVREGIFPNITSMGDEMQDFYFIEKDEPEEVLQVVVKLCRERIPARFRLNAIEDIQVLSPMHRGAIGAQRLNAELQEALNPQKQVLERGGRSLRLLDKVMQIRNNYDKEVFNGDLGRIRKIDQENQILQVEVDGRLVDYGFDELDELVLAYAVTVHKAQGSEYPAVVLPLLTQHYLMLQRNLLYTAITRGRRLVVIVGSKKALAIAVKNDKTQKRFTLLKRRLMGWNPTGTVDRSA
jgi:exodeoxyribonuclease V alpha subunit